jgi:hypothetical protein
MPKIGLDESNRSHSIFDADRFSLKNGEKARVLLLESEFDVEYVHWVDDEDAKGYYICQGDYNTVLKNGDDTTHCKFCQLADKGGAVKKARRKFATLLVVYRTNSKGQVLTPVAVDVVPWVFGDDKYTDLLGKKGQWGDLKSHDLMVECLGEQFQKMRIDVLPDAVWLSNDETKALVVASWKETKGMYTKDLHILLGRDITDPEKLSELISDLSGNGNVPDYASAGAMESIYSDASISTPETVTPDFGEMLSDTPSAPADPASSEAPASDTPSLDFDDLLK